MPPALDQREWGPGSHGAYRTCVPSDCAPSTAHKPLTIHFHLGPLQIKAEKLPAQPALLSTAGALGPRTLQVQSVGLLQAGQSHTLESTPPRRPRWKGRRPPITADPAEWAAQLGSDRLCQRGRGFCLFLSMWE